MGCVGFVTVTKRPVEELEFSDALKIGCLHSLERLFARHEIPHDTHSVINMWEEVAMFGHLHVLEWLNTLIFRFKLTSSDACQQAARHGHFEVLKWLVANGCSLEEDTSTTCCLVAESGNLEMLQWVRAAGCSWNEQTCAFAALSGNLEMLQCRRRLSR